VPLVLLAIPSICAGWVIGPVLYGGYFGHSISIAPTHSGLREMAEEFHGVLSMMAQAVKTVPFWMTVAGIAAAWYLYILKPELPAKLRQKLESWSPSSRRNTGSTASTTGFFAGGARKFGQRPVALR